MYASHKTGWSTWLELVLLVYFLYGIGLSFYLHDYFLIPFFVLMAWGLLILVAQTLALVNGKAVLKTSLGNVVAAKG